MSQQYDSSKGSDAFILCSIIGLVGIYFFFQYNYHLIVYVWRAIRVVEMGIFYWIPDWFPFYGKLEIKQAVKFLISTPAIDIMPITVSRFDRYYLRWFSIFPGLLMVYWGVKRVLTTGGVSTRYNMESLLKSFTNVYPYLNEYIDNHPEKQPLIYKRNQKETHISAMQLSPVDFATAVPPYGLEQKAKQDTSYKLPIWDGEDGFDENLAELSFRSQLGRSFNGIGGLRDYEKRIFDELTKKLSVDQESKIEWYLSIASHVVKVKNKQLNIKHFGEGMKALLAYVEKDFSKASLAKTNSVSRVEYLSDSLVAKAVSDEGNAELQQIFKLIFAEKIMASHAFIRCGLMQLMEKARDSGVLASYTFKWVIKYDRCLWSCFSSVGRKTPHPEAAGCFAHWVIEKDLQRALSHPEVTEAVEGLKKALWLDRSE